MKLILTETPKNPIIIEGFPGFGLVGTISTEYLINTLKAKMIGYIKMEEAPPMLAIHEGEIVKPLGVFYDKKNNLVILHVMTNVAGFEWKLSEKIIELHQKLNAKEIISIEGVGSMKLSGDSKSYFFSNKSIFAKKFKSHKIDPLNEGIIMGVTATLMLQADSEIPISCIFAETHSNLPDSKAAAKIIEVLDKYLGLKVDYKPLLKQAEKFETKIQKMLKESQRAKDEQKKKQLSYLG